MASLAKLLLAAALSSAMLALSFPPAEFGFLAFVAFAPLLAAIRGKSFGWGFLGALAACLLAAWWTVLGWPFPADAFSNHEQRMEGSASWHFMGFLAFGVVGGLVAGIFAEVRRWNVWIPLILAALAVSLESLTYLLLPAQLGVTQFRSTEMLAVSSVGGLTGVSLLVWWVNLAFACWWVPPVHSSGRAHRQALAAVAAVIAISAAARVEKLPSTIHSSSQPGAVRLAALQFRSESDENLMDVTLESGAWLTVWPELSGIPFVSNGDPKHLIAFARESGVRIATSFQDGARPKPHNALSIIGPDGESKRYWKRKLFGGESQMHTPGRSAAVAKVDGVAVGLNICFDSCFPSLIRETVDLGAEVIVLPSMGPESPHGFVQAVHGAYTVFRSAEFGVPIVRGETSSYATITDARGKVLAFAPPGYQGAIVADVALGQRSTVYKSVGEWVIPASVLAVALWITAGLRSRFAQSRTDLDRTEPSGSTS